MLTRSIPNLILLRESLYTFSTVSTDWLSGSDGTPLHYRAKSGKMRLCEFAVLGTLIRADGLRAHEKMLYNPKSFYVPLDTEFVTENFLPDLLLGVRGINLRWCKNIS
jgi:hypothetical protein